jgi:hypothetical protein
MDLGDRRGAQRDPTRDAGPRRRRHGREEHERVRQREQRVEVAEQQGDPERQEERCDREGRNHRGGYGSTRI